MNSKSILFIFLICLSFSCKNKTEDKNEDYSSLKQSSDNTATDTLNFDYFLSLVADKREIPEYLYRRFFSDSLNLLLQNQKETNGFLEVNGNSYSKIKNHYIFDLNTGAGTACEISTFVIFDNSGFMTDFKSFYYCDCNEPICKGENASIYNDSLIKVETHTWTGEPDEDNPVESFNENTVLNEYYSLNSKGRIISQQNIKNYTDQKAQNKSISYYICYNSDNNSNLKISIGFNNKSKASSVKYKGMNSSMELVFIKEEDDNQGGSYPVLTTYYNEINQGKITGIYKLTHSGNWDYVEYIRGKDSKKFNFTIDHNSNNYAQTPCF